MRIGVFPAHVSVWGWWMALLELELQSLNVAPQEEQPVLATAEPSFLAFISYIALCARVVESSGLASGRAFLSEDELSPSAF